MILGWRLIQSYDEFSIWESLDGTRIYLDDDLEPWGWDWDRELANALHDELGCSVEGFEKFAAATLARRVEIVVCADCDELERLDESREINFRRVCDTCLENYRTCEWCAAWGHEDDDTWYWVNDGETLICDSCESHTFWCEDCDGRYHNDDRSDHNHHDCDCESPQTTFTVRNDGDPELRNDVETTISLPSGVISDEGIRAICRYLCEQEQWHAANVADLLDPAWQTKQGNFTKRLSREVYKTDGSKLSPEIMSHVGNIARDHSVAVNHVVAVTRRLNLSPAEFAHEDSCWWQSYTESRCALKSNGGFGLRAFDEDGDVVGRAWVLPVRDDNGTLIPTFETLEPDGFIVFNGYGTLSGYTAPRIVAHMAGMTYRRVALSISPMYVNSDSGHLVAPEPLAARYTDGSISLSVASHASLYEKERQRVLVTA